MNIINISTEFGDMGITGGLAKATYSLSLALKKKGHDIQVIVPSYQKTKHVLQISGIPVHQILLKRVIAEHLYPSYGVCITNYKIVDAYFYPFSSVNPDRSALEAMLEFNQLAHRKIIELKEQGWIADLVILNDWQTGMCAQWLNDIKTLLIIHNASYIGFDPYYFRDAERGNWLKNL
ncbi:MAG: glycogen/starch synthase [Synechococcaceae cyanobacterium SM1_2_3]|nr:glycogen/starch synthase [Synechococcaceae cyanobacterium SM1_2_3]